MRARVWQGLLDWWKPARAPAGDDDGRFRESEHERQADRDPPAPGAELAAARGWQTRPLDEADASPLDGEGEGEPLDQELAEFLAADLDPVEADPEFKRRLRKQLWDLIQESSLTRQ